MKEELINNAESLREYIDIYEDRWKHSVDASPFGIQRSTEQRMIKELKALVERQNNNANEFINILNNKEDNE